MSNTIHSIFIAIGLVVSAFVLFVPVIFAFLASWMAESRGRTRLPAFNLGLWFGPIYLVYLFLQTKHVVMSTN